MCNLFWESQGIKASKLLTVPYFVAPSNRSRRILIRSSKLIFKESWLVFFTLLELTTIIKTVYLHLLLILNTKYYDIQWGIPKYYNAFIIHIALCGKVTLKALRLYNTPHAPPSIPMKIGFSMSVDKSHLFRCAYLLIMSTWNLRAWLVALISKVRFVLGQISTAQNTGALHKTQALVDIGRVKLRSANRACEAKGYDYDSNIYSAIAQKRAAPCYRFFILCFPAYYANVSLRKFSLISQIINKTFARDACEQYRQVKNGKL